MLGFLIFGLGEQPESAKSYRFSHRGLGGFGGFGSLAYPKKLRPPAIAEMLWSSAVSQFGLPEGASNDGAQLP